MHTAYRITLASHLQDKFGMRKTVLGSVVKKLQAMNLHTAAQQDSASGSSAVPFEARLENILDRLKLSLKPAERVKIKELAVE